MENSQESNNVYSVNRDAHKSNNVAYIALLVSLISLGLSGWMFYSTYKAESNKPKTMDEKVDHFFEQQDKEFDKIFEEGDTVNE